MTIRAGLFDDVARIVTDRLGEAATYDPSGTPTLIDGVFDDAYERVELSGGVPIASVSPMMLIRDADLPAAPAKGDRLHVRGQEYEVMVVRTDGQGASELDLRHIGVAV